MARLVSFFSGVAVWTLWQRVRQRLSAERALRNCHEQLLLLLRTWLLAVEIMKTTNLASNKSYASLIRLPLDSDYDGG